MTDKTLGAYQRHEKHDTADFATAEFARHPDGRTAVRGHAPLGGRPWSTAGWVEYTDADMAQGGWSPVRECPEPEQHVRYDAALADAEKAEKERDGAQETASAAYHAMQEVRDQLLAAESRPLTPDAITDEMVERAWAWASRHELYGSGSVRILLEEALTEPPARPEGAEAIEAILRDYGINDGEQDFADFLAKRGVRVVGEERS